MKRSLEASTLVFWTFALCGTCVPPVTRHGQDAHATVFAAALPRAVELWAQAPASAGRPRPPEQGEFTLKVDVNMVLVEATVRDDKGRIVNDLKREDFRVFEDGVEQQITYFSRDELPLAVALVVDGSGSISPVLPELHHAAYDTLSQLKPEDQVALYAFATHPERLVDLTTDRKSIADEHHGHWLRGRHQHRRCPPRVDRLSGAGGP